MSPADIFVICFTAWLFTSAYRFIKKNKPSPKRVLPTEDDIEPNAFPSPEVFHNIFVEHLYAHFAPNYPSQDILAAMVAIADQLYADEQLFAPLERPLYPDIIEDAKYQDALIVRARRAANAQHVMTLLSTAIFTRDCRIF